MRETPTAKSEEKNFAQNALNAPLNLGDKYYLINTSWYSKWADYIGLIVIYDDAHGHYSPGIINNSNLLADDGKSLRQDISEEADYKLVPEDLWLKLKENYRITSERDIIERKVIDDSNDGRPCLKIEVQYLKVKVSKLNETPTPQIHVIEMSRQALLTDVIKKIREIYNMSASKSVKLYLKANDLEFTLIENYENKTLNSCGYTIEDVLYLSVENDDGTWLEPPREIPSARAASASKNTSDRLPIAPPIDQLRQSSNSTVVTRSTRNNYNDYSYSSRYNDSRPGLCGLSNLGNTCFMNSALQCMSNVPLLTDYFTSSAYRKDINTVNPLGRKGELAYAYADLITEMWNGQNSYAVPRTFKMHISRFAPQFTGYQQQDSQELLAYTLDGLHEDLNRILKKPYVETSDGDGKSDEDYAKETWENYLKRNSSIIVDLFHGLIKSTLNCLKCGKISIKFDPICHLSLPLPSKKERFIEIVYVPLDENQPLMKYKPNVLKNGSISDLCVKLQDYINVAKQNLVVCDVYSSKFFHVYDLSEPVSNIRERDDIYIYELPTNYNNIDYIKFQFYLKQKNQYAYANTYFGLPLFVCIPKKELTVANVNEKAFSLIKRFINTENLNLNDNSTNSSSDEVINTKLSNSLYFDDDQNSEPQRNQNNSVKNPNKLFKLFISKADQYDHYDNQNQIIDEKILAQLASSQQHTYLLIAEFSTQFKDHIYDAKKIQNVTEHESCSAKLINKRDVLNLDDCFNLFTKKEELSDSDLWYCPSCKEHQHATKQIDLWTLPQVLIIHLKRFSYSRIYRDKIDTLVDFPITNLDLTDSVKNTDQKIKNNKYNLIAVSNHYGGLGGGHYTAYAQNRYDGRWYNFDDSSVTSHDEASVCTSAAYLLVYLRQDLHAQYFKSQLNQNPSSTYMSTSQNDTSNNNHMDMD